MEVREGAKEVTVEEWARRRWVVMLMGEEVLIAVQSGGAPSPRSYPKGQSHQN
jgi:hypothetical protein